MSDVIRIIPVSCGHLANSVLFINISRVVAGAFSDYTTQNWKIDDPVASAVIWSSVITLLVMTKAVMIRSISDINERSLPGRNS